MDTAQAAKSSQPRLELVDTYLLTDDQGRVYALEVWADVSYVNEFGMSARTVGRSSFRLRDGSRLIKQRDDRFFNVSTGQVLRRSA